VSDKPSEAPKPTPEQCLDLWCKKLPGYVAGAVAQANGELLGDVAVAVGDTKLALTWARTLSPDGEVTRAAGLLRVARAFEGREGVSSTDVRREAIASIMYEADLFDVLVRDSLDEGTLALLARRKATGDALFDAAVDAWTLVHLHDKELAAREMPRLAAVYEATASDKDIEGHRCLLATGLWRKSAMMRGGDVARWRDIVLAYDPVLMRLHVQRAIIVAASVDLPLFVDKLSWFAKRDIIDVYERINRRDAALAAAGNQVWALGYLARVYADDERAPQWIASLEAYDEHEAHLEGLITERERNETTLERIALRARNDATAAREELVALVDEAILRTRETIDEERAWITDVVAGRKDLDVEPNPRWYTPEGERGLESRRRAWRACTDERARYRESFVAKKILEAATAFALKGDRDRAMELLEEVYAGNRELVSFYPKCQPELVAAWIATDQAQLALNLAFADPELPAEALAPVIVETAAYKQVTAACELLARGIERARSWSELFMLARGVLAVADEEPKAAKRMLDAYVTAAETFAPLEAASQ